MEKAVYKTADGVLKIVSPFPGINIEDIVRKEVPAGLPYKLINKADLPVDRTFMAAWDIDLSEPDGYGIGPEAWFAEQEAG